MPDLLEQRSFLPNFFVAKKSNACKKFCLIARYPKSADFGLKQLSEAVLQSKSGHFKGKLKILGNVCRYTKFRAERSKIEATHKISTSKNKFGRAGENAWRFRRSRPCEPLNSC
jgi:hypothetical protein